jgi:hypothetical protein
LNLQTFRYQILSLARLPFRHVRVAGKMPDSFSFRNCADAHRACPHF